MDKFKIQFISLFVVMQLGVFSIAKASEIKEITAEAGVGNIKISWPTVNLLETESIILLRKEGVCPKFYQDGEEVYRGNGQEHIDRDAEKGKKYCYGGFVYDFSGRMSEIKKTGLVEKLGTGEYLTKLLISKNNFFIVIEIVIFLVLAWVNLRRRGFFERKSKFRILRVDEK
jgi:hypothetical protein